MALTDAFKFSIYTQLDAIELLRTVLEKTHILKFYQPHMRKQKHFKGIIEPHLGIIEPLLGIKKPAKYNNNNNNNNNNDNNNKNNNNSNNDNNKYKNK